MFGRWRQGRARITHEGPAGYILYAIGDVHGRLDLLEGLLGRIGEDFARRGASAKPLLVLLGDLIDRGPRSREVIDRLLGPAIPGFRTIAIAGNHEEVLLRLLDGEPGLLSQWLGFGGAECMESYGLDVLRLRSLPENAAIDEIRAVIPPSHQEFLRSMGDTFRFGDYLFVHAGIRPGIAIEQQSPLDLRWIREPFLGDGRDHGVMVVHGHTMASSIDERRNRIGIDTGAYRSGILTALAVEGADRWFLQQDEQSLADAEEKRQP